MNKKSMRVFIVDDEASIVDWMIKNIEWEVYNCKITGHATNATEALCRINEHPVDLLLTDISMPEVSGLELIKSVKERFPEILIIVISAYDKFSYVRDAFQYGIINYCLKPINVNELQECLKIAMMTFTERQKDYYNQDRRVFRNSIFLNLLSGEIDAIKFKEQSALAGIDFGAPSWQVVLMDISVLEEPESIALLKYYREMEYKGYYCFLDLNMNLVFILYGEAVSNETFRIQKMLKGDIDITGIFLCIGEPLSSYRQIVASYQVCLDFLNANFIFHGRVLQTRKYSYEKYLDVLKGSELQLLIRALKAYDRAGMVEIIEAMIKRCGTEEEKNAEIICLTVFLIKNTIAVRAAQNMTINMECLDIQDSSDKMLRWVERFCGKLINTNEQIDSLIHPSVKYVLQEINNRYMDSTLSMKEIAERRGMSPAYLGTLFKEQTGELFNDFLLKSRLEKVLELLVESKLNIGEIAIAAGFTSQSYLNRVFRRKYGMPPAEYRRKKL